MSYGVREDACFEGGLDERHDGSKPLWHRRRHAMLIVVRWARAVHYFQL